ncbi:MAG: SDR family oxidoreductase [Melioribacteraceae bacterium]|nr:SDR family oxidoreductase [Melioribacteraceae bacterium]
MYKYPLAVITGASRGIGKKVAVGLAEDGYKTILFARSNKGLKETESEIKNIIQEKEELLPDLYPVNITDHKRVEESIEAIKEKYGRIDILFNNAGIWSTGSLDYSVEEYKNVLETNLVAQYSFLKNTVPVMKKNKSGYIFNLASRAGIIGFPGSGTYVSSKFGLVGLSKSLYAELAEYKIKVTALCPSYVNTDMSKQVNPPISRDNMIQPEDILKTVRYLLTLSHDSYVKEIIIECRTSLS